MRGLLFERGSLFRVTRDMATHALTSWNAPYTGDEECVIPAGTILNLIADAQEPVEQAGYEPVSPPTDLPAITWASPEGISLLGGRLRLEGFREVRRFGQALTLYPENGPAIERIVIPPETRNAAKYSGYWFSLDLTLVGSGLDFLQADGDFVTTAGQTLMVDLGFECHGLRLDNRAVRCRVPPGVKIVAQHHVLARRAIAGWEATHDNFTWWRRDTPHDAGAVASRWKQAVRECPSHFIAKVLADSLRAVDADAEFESVLVPAHLLDAGMHAA